MRLRIVDIDLFLDYKLRQNKGARGNMLPYVKYVAPFDTPKGAAIREEEHGHEAIAIFYDMLRFSTGCNPRGLLADSEHGYRLDWIANRISCPMHKMTRSLPLLIRYGWLADDDGEIQPSLQTGKVLTSRPSSAEHEAEAESSAGAWHDVAVQLVSMWHEAGARQKKVADPADVKKALFERCKTDYAKADVILANACEYVATVEPEWMLKIVNWIKQGLATAPPKPIKAKHSIELTPEEIAASEAWEAQMRAEHAEGKISDEAMKAWGLL